MYKIVNRERDTSVTSSNMSDMYWVAQASRIISQNRKTFYHTIILVTLVISKDVVDSEYFLQVLSKCELFLTDFCVLLRNDALPCKYAKARSGDVCM